MNDDLYLLVTYINKDTLDTFKFTVAAKRNTQLGQNYQYFREPDVIPLFPKPNIEGTLVIIDVIEIDGILNAE